jgi:hypothetical protein
MDLRMEDYFFLGWAAMGVLVIVWGIRKLIARRRKQ